MGGLNEGETEVVIHEEGPPKSTWDDLLKSCPKDSASFLVWDDAPTNKVVGIYYSDDNLKAQKKMVGSAAWIQVRSLFEGNGMGKILMRMMIRTWLMKIFLGNLNN